MWLPLYVVGREIQRALAQPTGTVCGDRHGVAEDGHASLLFAPHVGLDNEGVPFLERPGDYFRIVWREGYKWSFIAQATAMQDKACSPSSLPVG